MESIETWPDQVTEWLKKPQYAIEASGEGVQSVANSQSVSILLVEDSLADVGLIREVFKQVKTQTNITVASDGEKALDYLREKNAHQNFSLPDLILLDLNIPKKDGLEVLKQIKADNDLKKILVLILSNSRAPADISASYELHANGYIIKPQDIDEYFEIGQAIEHFWFKVVTLAPHAQPFVLN